MIIKSAFWYSLFNKNLNFTLINFPATKSIKEQVASTYWFISYVLFFRLFPFIYIHLFWVKAKL